MSQTLFLIQKVSDTVFLVSGTLILAQRVSDTLFLRPSILSKWSGLRGLVEQLRERQALAEEGAQPRRGVGVREEPDLQQVIRQDRVEEAEQRRVDTEVRTQKPALATFVISIENGAVLLKWLQHWLAGLGWLFGCDIHIYGGLSHNHALEGLIGSLHFT